MFLPIDLRRLLVVSLFGLLSGSVYAADAGSISTALELIKSKDLRKYVTVLASDTLEGREAGSRGGRAAGVYLIEQLRKFTVVAGGTGKNYYQHFGADYRNIIAVLKGSDPRLKQEYILVGAHYDHVGYGNSNNSFGPTGHIHNGADDNASGTAGLLELIEALSSLHPRPKRSILFAFWDAEEKGLLGSEHWIRHPTVPLSRVRLLINLDMIGRLRNNTVEIYGVRTAPGLRRLISEQNHGFNLHFDFNWDNIRNSDHYPFFQRRIPFLMPHTRKHADYHRPSDDIDKLNLSGIQRLVRLMFRTIYAAAEKPKLPKFRPSSFQEDQDDRRRLAAGLSAEPGRLGVSWRRKFDGHVTLTAVNPGTPAYAAGLKVGDRILEFGEHRTDGESDFRTLVLSASNPVAVVVEREDAQEPLKFTVRLKGKPRRFGIAWRVDAAEPGSVILTKVGPGSPGDIAGLRVNDRIHAIAGQTFTSNSEFHRLLSSPRDVQDFVVETRGRIRTVQVKLLPRPNPKPVKARKPVSD